MVEEDLRAVLDVRGFTREGDYQAPILVEWTTQALAQPQIEITPEPESVRISLEQKLLRGLEVRAVTNGFPPAGYELVQVQVSPSAVQVEGPKSVVEELTVIETEEVNLANRRDDFSERIRLVAPSPLLSFPGGAIVEMRGTVDEKVVLQTYTPVDVVVSGLPQRLRITNTLESGEIRVQARQVDVDQTDGGTLLLSVDASRVTETGVVRLPVRPIVPRGFVVLRYAPTSVQLTVTAGSEEE